jgi:hypothetical protein
MSKHLFLIFFLLFCFSEQIATAQSDPTDKASLTWGEGKRAPVFPIRFVGYDGKKNLIFYGQSFSGGALLGGGYTNSESCFIVFSPDLVYEEYINIEIPKLKVGGEEYETLKDIKNIRCVSLGDTSYIIGSAIGGSGLFFYAWQIDPIKKKVQPAVRIGEIKGITKLREEMHWSDSPNHALGLLSADIDKRGEDREYIYCMIVDASMAPKNQLKAVVPYDRKDFDFKDITIDDLGRVLVTGEVDIDRADRVDRKVKSEPVALSFAKDRDPKKVNLQFEDKKIQTLKTSFNATGTGVAVGFYGNDRFSEQDGIFFATLDADGEMSKPQTHEFDSDFLVSTLKENRQDRAKKRMDETSRDESEADFVMREVKQMPDGSLMAIAENFRIVTVNQNGGMNRNSYSVNDIQTYYEYGDFIVARFGPDGSMDWVKKVGRQRQRFNVEFKQRYATIIKDDKLYLFYQDEVPKSRKGIDALCIISPSGSFEEVNLTDKKTKGFIDFDKTYQVGKDELILVRNRAGGGMKKYIGRLKIE